MIGKFLAVGALLGGIVFFAWQAFSHMALPVWECTMSEFTNQQAIDLIKSSISGNGLYFAKEGFLMSTFFVPGVTDTTQLMAPMLLKQFLTNCVVALLIAFVITRMPPQSFGVYLRITLLWSLVGWLLFALPNGTWYGWPIGYLLLDLCDRLVGVALLTAAIVWLAVKMKITTA
ncbi:hypothetical protein HZB60_09485 [candidate division KSB1 bacterium]|nr:hypothetical protein [candidate division KSB1 bacterium]